MSQTVDIFMVGFKIKRLLVLIVVTMVITLTFSVMAVFSMGMPTVNWLANTPDAKSAETQGFYMGDVMPGNTYAWGNCT